MFLYEWIYTGREHEKLHRYVYAQTHYVDLMVANVIPSYLQMLMNAVLATLTLVLRTVQTLSAVSCAAVPVATD